MNICRNTPHIFHAVGVCLYMFFNSAYAAESKLDSQLSLSINGDAGYTDNFLLSADEKQSTQFYSLTPQFYLSTQAQQSLFELTGQATSVVYSRFEQDDHTDYALSPTFQFKFAQNKTLYFEGKYNKSYELRGQGLSLGDATSIKEGDDKATLRADIGYQYGSESSAARWLVQAGYVDFAYQSRRLTTKVLDQKVLSLMSRFDYLLSGKTYLAFELQHSQVNFTHNKQLDKDKQVALAGVKWATTEISELQFLVGFQRIDFDQVQFEGDSTFKWRLDYLWKPTINTEFHLQSEKLFEEPNRLSESYNLVNRHQLSSKWKMTDYFHVDASLALTNQKVIYRTSQETEDYLTTTLQLNYIRNQRLKFHLRYEMNDLNATNNLIDYQRNTISLGVDFTL